MSLLFKISKNKKTIIMISHRLDNLQHFDEIYIMKNSVLVKKGSYKELMES